MAPYPHHPFSHPPPPPSFAQYYNLSTPPPVMALHNPDYNAQPPYGFNYSAPPNFVYYHPNPPPQDLFPLAPAAAAPPLTYGGYTTLPPPVHGGYHRTDRFSSFVKGATLGKLVHEALVFVAGKVVFGNGDLNFETSCNEIFKH